MPVKNKTLDLKGLKKIRQKFLKKKIVLCHGVFDLLHIGHINYFKSSKILDLSYIIFLVYFPKTFLTYILICVMGNSQSTNLYFS